MTCSRSHSCLTCLLFTHLASFCKPNPSFTPGPQLIDAGQGLGAQLEEVTCLQTAQLSSYMGGAKAHLLGSTNHAWVSRKAGHMCVCLGSDMQDTLLSGGF